MNNASDKPKRWRLFAPLLVTLSAGTIATAVPAIADDYPDECYTSGPTLSEARDAYADTCTLPRVDCDPIDEVWFCSSRVVGERAPGSISTDDVGQSMIGKDIVVPPTTTTQAPVTTTTEQPVPTTTEPPATTTTNTTAPPVTGELTTLTFTPTAGPDVNPLKGWNSGWWDDRSETTVGFQYIAWKDFEPQNGTFDYDAVEDIINRSGSRGRHVTLRLYCDWHGDDATSRGCPDWMYTDVGVKRIQGDNGRFITDYNDPRYLEEATQAIEALASRYDDDPRIFTFQLGIIGYWGEWHTWGSQVDGERYDITNETRTTILEAYQAAFDNVELVARYADESTFDGVNIGFHNDFFRPNNGHSASFDDAVAAGQRWLGGPIGGEVPPGLSSSDYSALYQTSQGREMIERAGYSTMKPGEVSNANLDEHLELHKRFGYNFQIDQARFGASASNSTAVELAVANVGIAPFYYDWDVQFALLDAAGNAVAIADSGSVDLTTIRPGGSATVASHLALDGVASGDYSVAVRIIQPGSDNAQANAWGLDVRNTYVLFANDMDVVDGSWGSGGELVGGWSILGSTTVTG